MTVHIPTRHPESPRPVPGMVKLLARALGIDVPSPRQWQRLGERLTVGDEPMDRLLDWMVDTGLAQTRPMFDRALTEGIAHVPEAPAPLHDFFAAVENTPEWLDIDVLRRGQRALRRGGADGMYVARDVSLLGGYQFAGFNKTLLRTGALEKGSNKRFAETMQWAIDVISEGGLEPLGIGYRSTIRVRLIHAFVRRHVANMPDWRADDWGVPVNQTDMAATLVGALVAPPVGGLGMGILTAPADLEAIAHLTRYVGWLIGVEDEWLPRDFRDAVRVLFHTLTALSAPDESTRQLATPMIDDPMSWHYDRLPTLRRKLARAQHLSVTSAFLGPRTMRMLGLPAYVPPWYPLLRLPVNVARSVVDMTVPGGMERAARRGAREQHALLRTMIGGAQAEIGESAEHVSRVA
ncbi:oxygenase MpaB family protein [Mycolicibacterium sp. 120266]|uniref:oxygenase MpaB family protein n=1 Tax=Mycolicibacterium sp. 120266 TaxID=3090601 RepID=UPI00299CE5A2|nr:oxygenase MpaB family protein [Mycolicibacterium sp. 120266]MDX1873032.1 oxygenase MpaB family protein [Mycolicibacterium sp. 120266]